MANVLIIGGGVSGLSAGIYARLHGHTATICEKHFIPGGNLTGWDRGGYHIDNCIHWLTGTNPNTDLYKTWEELGALGNVRVFEGESLYTVERDGGSVSLYSDLCRMEREMLKYSPEDKREIKSLVRTVKALQGFFGIKGEKHNKGASFSDIFGGIPSLLKYNRLSTGELANRFKSPLLGEFIRSFFGDDFASLALIFVMAHFTGGNGGIPEEGSFAMAERMADRFRSLGGELLLGKEVVRIEHRQGVARSAVFADGTEREFDYAVLTVDPAVAYGKLLDVPMPRRLERKYADPRFKRFSSYQCAFGCDTDRIPFVGDIIFDIPEKYKKRLPIEKIIIREFSHGSFAPKGKSIIQTMTFTSEEVAKRFIALKERSGAAYKRLKKYLADTLKGIILERFPELSGRISCLDVWTPASYKRFVGSEMGSWMSFVLPKKTLPIRDTNRVKGISNVILANQWQQIPGGLPIAAEGGKKAIKTVTALEKRMAARLRALSPKKRIKGV